MRQRLQLNFADSSDDDHAHTADFEVIPDGASTTAERRPGNRTEEANWFSRFMGRAATYLTSAATDPHEPIAEDETRGTAAISSEEGGIFDYGALGPRVDGSSLSSGQSGGDGATAPSPGASFGDAERDQFSVEVDLREAVLQYQRTPMDLYYNIVLATLQSGACRVNGDVMCAAVGYPKLIEAFLNSGVVDLEDVTVQQVVQDELSRVLSGDPWMDDVVDACDGDYLRCLCQVRSARITEPQLVLMRQSGCEIVKIIYDCPHILGNIEVNNGSVTYCILRLLSAGTFSGAWLGIVAFVVFLITVVWITILWLDSDGSRVYGYWTILCAVGGYVLGLVCTVMAEQHKIRTYEDVLWPYPDNHLKVLPFIPVYELVLLVTSMRYELLEDRRPFFIIRWDLRNGIATQQRIHGFFFVLPQTILQCYLYTIHDSSDGARNHWLWALCMSGLVVFYLASLAQIRVVLFTFSSDLFGFAVLAARRRGVLNPRAGKRVMPIRAAMQCCVFFTMNFSVACVAMTFILLVDGSSCRRVAASLLVVFLTVAILSLLMVVLFLLYASKPVSRWMGLFCLPCIILEMFFLIFYNTDPRGEGCRALSLQRWTIPVEITYALTCVSFVIWVIMLMYQSISGSEIEQRALDTFLEKF